MQLFKRKCLDRVPKMLVFPNKNLNDIMKIVKSLKKSILSVKVISTIMENKAKEQRELFLCIFLGILGDLLLGNLFADNKVVRVRKGVIAMSQERGTFKGDQDF